MAGGTSGIMVISSLSRSSATCCAWKRGIKTSVAPNVSAGFNITFNP